jgi:hypothetical protein
MKPTFYVVAKKQIMNTPYRLHSIDWDCPDDTCQGWLEAYGHENGHDAKPTIKFVVAAVVDSLSALFSRKILAMLVCKKNIKLVVVQFMLLLFICCCHPPPYYHAL